MNKIIKKIRGNKKNKPKRDWVLYCSKETYDKINKEVLEEALLNITKKSI